MAYHNKGQKLPGEVCTPDEVERVLEVCGRRLTGLRNRAAIVLMWRGGLRAAETCGVRRCDVTIDGGKAVVRVLNVKGAGRGKPPRVVGLGTAATKVLEEWIAARWRLSSIAPLCCTRTGRAMLPNYLRELLARLGREAGIEHRVHPHALRHSWAYGAAMRGMPTPVIMRALGHTSLTVTARYLDHLAPADVVAAMQEE